MTTQPSIWNTTRTDLNALFKAMDANERRSLVDEVIDEALYGEYGEHYEDLGTERFISEDDFPLVTDAEYRELEVMRDWSEFSHTV